MLRGTLCELTKHAWRAVLVKLSPCSLLRVIPPLPLIDLYILFMIKCLCSASDNITG